jgi:hypothetical protein
VNVWFHFAGKTEKREKLSEARAFNIRKSG